jgi:hypothetical protein
MKTEVAAVHNSVVGAVHNSIQQLSKDTSINILGPGHNMVLPSSIQAIRDGNSLSQNSDLLLKPEGLVDINVVLTQYQSYSQGGGLTDFAQVYSGAAEQLQAHLSASQQILLGLMQRRYNPLAAVSTAADTQETMSGIAAANRGSLMAASSSPASAAAWMRAQTPIGSVPSSNIDHSGNTAGKPGPYFDWQALGTVLPSTARSGNNFYGIPTASSHRVTPLPSLAAAENIHRCAGEPVIEADRPIAAASYAADVASQHTGS